MKSPSTVTWIALGASLLVGGIVPTPSTPPERELADAVEAIRHADFRGDRDELRRRAGQLAAPTSAALEKYRQYWRGFAYWRRAMNGFNETPTPGDLFADLELATAALRDALTLDPDFEDARSALAGALMNEMFLVSTKPAEQRTKVYQEGIAAIRAVKESAKENPRSLWILGGNEMGAPPPWGGDMAKAAAIYQRGLAAARDEASSEPRAPWEPSWGAAESLMSLAYLYSHGAATRPDVARAYALGALAMAPDWHYVRDILLPSIDGLAKTAENPPVRPVCAPGPAL